MPSPGASEEAKPFLGTWTIASANIKGSCGPLPFDQPLTGMQTVAAGTSSDLVFTVQPGCELLMDVTGDTATVRPNQTCSVTVGQQMVSGTVTSGTMKVAGSMATFDCAGTATIATVACNLTLSGTSTK